MARPSPSSGHGNQMDWASGSTPISELRVAGTARPSVLHRPHSPHRKKTFAAGDFHAGLRDAANLERPISPTWPSQESTKSSPNCQYRCVSPESALLTDGHRVFTMYHGASAVQGWSVGQDSRGVNGYSYGPGRHVENQSCQPLPTKLERHKRDERQNG